MNFDEAISFENLYKGLLKSQKNVMWKDSVAGYSLNGLKNTYKLRQELLNGTYRISQYASFKIKEPKERDVLATRIRDRQFQHALSDNVIYPSLTKTFIRDNCACQKGRGTFDALERLRKQLIKYAVKHKDSGWVLKADIHHFFPTTSHDVACNNLSRYDMDIKSFEKVCDIIRSFVEPQITKLLLDMGVAEDKADRYAHTLMLEYVYGDYNKNVHKALTEEQLKAVNELFTSEICGIGLGSQVSQLTELALLSPLDHFIKEKLHIEVYERYMDDFVLVHESKDYLEYCLVEIEKFLKERKLSLNPKTDIFKLKQGFTLLKWRIFVTSTGKVIMRKSKKNISKQRAKMRKLKAMIDRGERTIEDARNNFQSWQSGIHYFGCFNLVNKMRGYYYELFGEVAPKWKD